LHRVREGGKPPPPARLLTVDPGGTTGWALWLDGLPNTCGQIDTAESDAALEKLLDQKQPDLVICEAYVLYPWKADSQAWSDFQTPRLIGSLQTMCRHRQIPLIMQGADKKTFATDIKLKGWGFYQKSHRHANDAIRHGIYYLLFGVGTAKAEPMKPKPAGGQNSSRRMRRKPTKED
jgi:hypothetical protein